MSDSHKAGEMCTSLFILEESKRTDKDTTKQKKKLKDELLEVMSKHDVSSINIPHPSDPTKTLYFHRTGKQKKHPMSDITFLVYAFDKFCERASLARLTEADKKHLAEFLPEINMYVSKQINPTPVYSLTMSEQMPMVSIV
jgi:hypothetical protein